MLVKVNWASEPMEGYLRLGGIARTSSMSEADLGGMMIASELLSSTA